MKLHGNDKNKQRQQHKHKKHEMDMQHTKQNKVKCKFGKH